jgi:5-(carboxyamino)imidazole ribonucleotide mutase
MPGGIPVATVAINNAKNAGLLAIQMIGAFDAEIGQKVFQYRQELETSVKDKQEKLEKIGYQEYLKNNEN